MCENIIKKHFIKNVQPSGTMYIITLSVNEIDKIAEVRHRISGNDDKNYDVQRKLNIKRTDEISTYGDSANAIFPTSVIISGPSRLIQLDENNDTLSIDVSDKKYFSIIDGQHRFEGLKMSSKWSSNDNYTLPVTLVLDTKNYEDADIFVTVNSNQKNVSRSLIFDLFGISPDRTPEKVCHFIASWMNSDERSPYFNRLKMLGFKEPGQNNATLSQSAFVDGILPLVKNKDGVFHKYYKMGDKLDSDSINPSDYAIYESLLIFFNIIKSMFSYDWDSSKSIITKTTGFNAFLNIFVYALKKKISSKDGLKIFLNPLNKIGYKNGEKLLFTNEIYGSGKAAVNKLTEYLMSFIN